MRLLAALFALLVIGLPAVGQPPAGLEYRTKLRTDLSPGPGPVSQAGEIAYLLAGSTTHGVITTAVPGWTAASPAYPSADFWLVQLGALTAFSKDGQPLNMEVSDTARYYLDLEVRTADHRVGMLTFTGTFSTGWWGDYAFATPNDIPTWGTLWLDGMLYRIRMGYGVGGPYYQQAVAGTWSPTWFAADPVPIRTGGFVTQTTGQFYAEIIPVSTPEPSSWALAGIGLSGLLLVRRARQTLTVIE